jgi:uncharacterized protein (DUF1800 family)
MITKDSPWAAYEPTEKDPWDLRKVAHLHRRAGFGATWAELQRDLKAGPEASVERLLKPRAETAREKRTFAALKNAARASGDESRLKAYWLNRMMWHPDALREKLTLFWHGHFATSNRKVQNSGYMLDQNEVFRTHALGTFAPLLTAMITDPAMLVWLDGAGSVKGKPNENFGREFLELFTVGIGNYTEKDLREAARAFTGWTLENGKAVFKTAQYDAGAKTFLKRTGAWKPADIVRITLDQPACAKFLCRKLYRFLVSEEKEPPADLLRPLADEFRKSKYSVAHVVGIILRSRHFYGSAAYRQRVKGPVEYSAGLVRSLEVPSKQVRLLALAGACDRQEQALFHPPNVKGWDGGRAWINSTTVLERGNWLSDVVWGNPDVGMRPFDPVAWAKHHDLPAGKAVQALLDLVLQHDLSDRARELVLEAGRGGTTDDVRKALQRALNCPEYHLA